MTENARDTGFVATKHSAIPWYIRSALLLVVMAVVAPTLAMARTAF